MYADNCGVCSDSMPFKFAPAIRYDDRFPLSDGRQQAQQI